MKRLCFLCGKKIGFTRTFWDRHYCSAAHRRQAQLASSQVREEDDFESWAVVRSRKRVKPGTQGPTPGQAASAFAFFTVVGLLVVAFLLPGPGGGSDSFAALDLKLGMIDRASNFVSDMMRQKAPITLHYDFRAGIGDWKELALKVASRSTENTPQNTASTMAPEIVRPGSFRLWNKSVKLQNYQMEFLGQIDNKSLSWAFRATDQNNFYASTIVMTKP